MTGSTSQGQRNVHFWIAQRSAAQNVEGIYIGYVANPSNNEEPCLRIDYYIMELKAIHVDGCCSVVRCLPWLRGKNLLWFWKLSSKQDYERKAGKLQDYLHCRTPLLWPESITGWWIFMSKIEKNDFKPFECTLYFFKFKNNIIAKLRVIIYCWITTNDECPSCICTIRRN